MEATHLNTSNLNMASAQLQSLLTASPDLEGLALLHTASNQDPSEGEYVTWEATG